MTEVSSTVGRRHPDAVRRRTVRVRAASAAAPTREATGRHAVTGPDQGDDR